MYQAKKYIIAELVAKASVTNAPITKDPFQNVVGDQKNTFAFAEIAMDRCQQKLQNTATARLNRPFPDPLLRIKQRLMKM